MNLTIHLDVSSDPVEKIQTRDGAVRNDASHAAMIEYLTAQMRSAAPKLHVNVGGKGLLIASVTPEAAPKAKKKALVAAFEKACDGLFAEFSPKPFKR